LALHHAQGVNVIARHHQEKVVLCEVSDKGIRASFNTKEELKDLESTEYF
jgi:hypothetical protein